MATKIEEIIDKALNNAAKENMLVWDIERFKKTHPSLYKSFLQASKELIAIFNKRN